MATNIYPLRGSTSNIYRFEVTAVARNKGAVPVRLRYWSVREALSVERAYHNMGYHTHIMPLHRSTGALETVTTGPDRDAA